MKPILLNKERDWENIAASIASGKRRRKRKEKAWHNTAASIIMVKAWLHSVN